MLNIHKNITIFGISCLLLAACSNVKHLQEGRKLYTGATIELSGKDMTSREKKAIKSDLSTLTRPKPNSDLFGFRIKLYLYNLLRNKKEKSFLGKLRAKIGEPPVLLSSVDLTQNVKVLKSHLENRGFFNAQVTGDTIVKGKRGSAKYVAETGNQYVINSIEFVDDSTELTETIKQSAENTILKKGNPFILDVFVTERTRIDAYLKERGFYYFSPEYLLAKVDSTIGNHMVDMKVVVKPETPTVARKAYTINDINIYSNYSLNTAAIDTNTAYQKTYDGYRIIDKEDKYKPKMFENAMQFDSGDIYNRTDHNLTLNRLINLNIFKFVKNRFEPVKDSNQLDVFYYLTPLPKKSLQVEVGAQTKSNNLNGTQITLGFHNRNTFRAGEHLNVNLFGGTEVAISGTMKGYNTYRAGAEANFAIPRFVVPFFNITTKGGYMPRTNIQAGYEVLNRKKLYSLTSLRGAFGYLWKESLEKQHEFYPVSVTFVKPVNVTDFYKLQLQQELTLQKIIDTQFILGSTYQYNFNQQASGPQRKNSFYFNGLTDISGNVAGLLTGATGNEPGKIFNRAFAQYIKLEADGRYYRKIGLNSTWANRLIVGYGLPYGNSSEIPYIKQFFSGGNNSIRAFRSRSVGPGEYKPSGTTAFLPDQTGDIKLELNTEFRPKISGPIYGAVFVDAGNIWLKNDNPLKPGAKFTKDFIKELAVGAGVGLRVDITLFVIRVDVAVPLRKPWEDKPWVLDEINFFDKNYRKDNMVFNLAIGYPF